MRNARSLDPIEMTPEQLQQSLLDTQSRIEQGDRDGVLFAEGTLPASRSVAREVLGSWKPAPGTTAIPLANYTMFPYSAMGRVFFKDNKNTYVCSGSANGKNLGEYLQEETICSLSTLWQAEPRIRY